MAIQEACPWLIETAIAMGARLVPPRSLCQVPKAGRLPPELGVGVIQASISKAGVLKKDTPQTPEKLNPNGPLGRRVQARYPNHIFMADLTEVPGLLGIFNIKVAAVMDVFSRMPLIVQVFLKEPNSEAITNLFQMATKIFSTPRHFVSDQGSQFTAEAFRNTLKSRGVKQRFGAIGKTSSIAVIERFWKSIKGMLNIPFFKPIGKKRP